MNNGLTIIHNTIKPRKAGDVMTAFRQGHGRRMERREGKRGNMAPWSLEQMYLHFLANAMHIFFRPGTIDIRMRDAACEWFKSSFILSRCFKVAGSVRYC